MALQEVEILEILKEPRNKYISKFKEDQVILDIFYNGGDVATQLGKIKNYENTEQKALRDKLARSTKDLLSYLLSPTNKVFSASGFVQKIDAKTEETLEKATEYLEKLPEGISLRQWMQDFWVPAYVSDPNSIMLVEVDEMGRAYPTHKSIQKIHDYSHKWEEFDYIVFLHKKVKMKTDGDKKTEEVQIYRVYDDQKDGLYYLEGEGDKAKLRIYDKGDERPIYLHGLGRVPAFLPSNIKCTKTKGRKPLIHKIDEYLKEYLNDSSIHSIYKFLHGFPIFWRYASKCSRCNGLGTIKKKDANGKIIAGESITCPTCDGKKHKVTNDVSDGVVLPVPKAGAPSLGKDIAGYIQPDLQTWERQVEEMKNSRKEMFYSLWGTYLTDGNEGTEKTATQAYIDSQPVNDVLWSISTVGEAIEEGIMFNILDLTFPERINTVTSKWGRRYLTETPDVLWDKYIKAKKDEAAITVLDYLFKRFLMAEYHNDSVMLDQKMKEFYLEPFPHYTLASMKGIFKPEKIQRKMLFSEWISEGIDYEKDKEVLLAEFDAYVETNLDPIQEPEPTE